ncbi:hypothetical protein BRD00_15230 [Halobacteriales archaeon QS_8_69_26]|nr:MAG: hypothetical protein BRD00_15230 [Halobacteriales archaeon QS_8_69_26]
MTEDDSATPESAGGGILVADGTAEAGRRVADALGGTTSVVGSLEEAVGRARSERPDLVVVSQSLEGGTGTELVRDLRGGSAVPVVLYARDGDEELASEAVAAGADEYVPVDGDGRLDEASVDRVVEACERADAGESSAPAVPFETLVEHAPVGTCALDGGTVRYANDRLAELFATAPEMLVGTDLADLVADHDRDRIVAALDPGDGEVTRATFTGLAKDGTEVEVGLHATAPPDGEVDAVATVVDVEGRRGRERQLTVLHETTREMMRTEDRDDIARLAVETAIDVLDLLSVAIYLYDRDAGTLEQAASASGVIDLPAGISPVDEYVDVAWDVFVHGEERLITDLPDGDSEGPIRSGLAIPLGDHGVFVAGGTAPDEFDETVRRFARTLATNTEVALDRAAREATVMERTERLREQNEQLDRLRRIDAVVRDIGQLLVRATSREQVEREVCERLADVRYWEFAWVGEREVTGPGIVPRTWAEASSATDGESYLEAVRAAGDRGPFTDTPAERALAEGTVVVTEDVVASHDDESWRTVTLDQGFRSVASIPLEHEHREYGVLEVYGDRPDAFGGEEREVLTELADMIAYSLNAIERERALVAETGPELEVRIGETDEFFSRLSAETGGRVAVEGIVPGDEGTYLTYVGVEDADDAGEDLVDAVTRLADRSTAALGARAIDPERGRFELHLAESDLFESVTTHGATIKEITAEADGITVRIGLPGTADVRGFVEAFGRAYPDLEVLAQRSAVEGDHEDLQGDVTAELTDRQREVLEVAYHSGFFEWPRESTGEDIADSLDVSPPTVHKHLRTAERKLLSAILGARRSETERIGSAEQ